MRKNLVEAQARWQEPTILSDNINEFFTDMLTIEEEKRMTGEQIFAAWMQWRKQRQ
jgi:hypothetical protein